MSVLHDLEAYTGAHIISAQLGMRLSQTDPVTVVGKVKECKIDKSKTVLIGGEGLKV